MAAAYRITLPAHGLDTPDPGRTHPQIDGMFAAYTWSPDQADAAE